jgi:predicted acetyltransferase
MRTIMDLTLRPIVPDEFPAFHRAAGTAFGDQDDGAQESERAVFEFDRSLAAFDGSTVVATSNMFTLSLRVPGGEVACPVISFVSVARTHRRRGLLNRIMDGLLDSARERDEPLAALFASESTIYGRYGFGPATHEGGVRIERRHAAFRRDAPAPGHIRTLEATQVEAVFGEVYDAVRRQVLGMPSRSASWWRHMVLSDTPSLREGHGPKDLALHEGEDGPDGYAISRIKPAWQETGPDGTLQVIELVATTPSALAGLWRYCLDADLCEHVVADRRPAAEPLAHLLADPRRLQRSPHDGLWLRFVDLPAALAARAWSGTDRLTLDVADAFRPDQGGAWTLDVTDGTAACSRAAGAPDVELDTEALAACYLGDTRPSALLAAGRLRERTQGAARRLDQLLGVPEPVWVPQEF